MPQRLSMSHSAGHMSISMVCFRLLSCVIVQIIQEMLSKMGKRLN